MVESARRGREKVYAIQFLLNVNRREVARCIWRREHMGDREICFFFLVVITE